MTHIIILNVAFATFVVLGIVGLRARRARPARTQAARTGQRSYGAAHPAA